MLEGFNIICDDENVIPSPIKENFMNMAKDNFATNGYEKSIGLGCPSV